MSIKKITTCLFLLCLLMFTALCTGCGKIELIHYNSLTITGEDGTRDIEGSYTKDMDIDEFESLTGLPVSESLPQAYQTEPLSVLALYDKDDKIVNITVGLGNEDSGYSASMSVYSTDLWSDVGYSPIGDMYGDETSDVEVSKIGLMTTLFYRYDDSKETQNKLGHDVYISQFSVNSLIIYVESTAMRQDDFEQFAAALIAVGNV